MQEILFRYDRVSPTTWVYLSSLLTIAIYFKFSRLWSIRNLDLFIVLLLAPGLLLEAKGREDQYADLEHLGYIWLFIAGGVLLLRILLDSMMVRRPLLEANLSLGGMTFIGTALLVFLMANVASSDLDTSTLSLSEIHAGEAEPPQKEAVESTDLRPAIYRYLPNIATQRYFIGGSSSDMQKALSDEAVRKTATSRTIAILAHLAIVIGLIWIGYRHFDNIGTGVSTAVLYLLLPYTAEMTGNLDHVLPAACLVWAIAFYRRPLVSGLFVGLAIGLTYYAAFLLFVWMSFYFRRGLIRFLISCAVAIGVTLCVGVGMGIPLHAFLDEISLIFTFPSVQGFWTHRSIRPEYMLTVFALFAVLCGSFALWPVRKNLATLLSCSAAVMLAVQFWHGTGGGLFMNWYLPLAILTIFRPNLEDRVPSFVPKKAAATAGDDKGDSPATAK